MYPILNQEEFQRLVRLLELVNDTSITQIDHDESDELRALLERLAEEQ